MTRRYWIRSWLAVMGAATVVSFAMSLAGAAEGQRPEAVPPTTVPTTSVPTTTVPTTTVPTTTTQAWLTTPALPLLNGPVEIPLPQLPVPIPDIPPLVTNRAVAQPPRPAPVPLPPYPSAGRPTAQAPSVPAPSPPVTAAPLRTAAITPRDKPPRSPDIIDPVIPTVKQFTIPLVLTMIVALFLVLQARFDRRDPKLVAAPMVDDLHAFR
ncbi:MAG: hypothetical protein M3378_07565 [Actinomycetota bacterium]|nr:hypothetical protein [Actinomycetota bacterium]